MSKKAILGDEFCYVLDYSTCEFYPVKYEAGNSIPVRLPYKLHKSDICNLYCSFFLQVHGFLPWAVAGFNKSKVYFYSCHTRGEFIMLFYCEILRRLNLLKLGMDEQISKIFIYTNTLNSATCSDFKFCISFK